MSKQFEQMPDLTDGVDYTTLCYEGMTPLPPILLGSPSPPLLSFVFLDPVEYRGGEIHGAPYEQPSLIKHLLKQLRPGILLAH